MTVRPYLLGAVALALGALVVWDYWPTAPQATTATPQANGLPADAATQLAMLNPLSRLTDADFAPLFDRPLFDPTRSRPAPVTQPLDASPAPVAVETPSAPKQPAGPPQPVLMGTVTSPWPGGAYLGDDAGGPVVFLRPGQASLGLHLEAVQKESALFMGPQGEVTLPLRKTEPAARPQDGTAAGAGVPQPGEAVTLQPTP